MDIDTLALFATELLERIHALNGPLRDMHRAEALDLIDALRDSITPAQVAA